MRIIGGYAAGVKLDSPVVGPGYKPTMDRVREAIFSSLEPWLELTVVDLFSCSGALGLEALSRGATQVAWFEQDRRNARIIEGNLKRVQPALRQTADARVFNADVMMAPRLLASWEPDIILADPPYNPNDKQKGSLDLLMNDAFREWAGEAVLVMEQSKHNPLAEVCLKTWEALRVKKYGNNLVYYLRARATAD